MEWSRRRLLRMFGGLAAAVAVALGIRYWASHRKVSVDLEVQVPERVRTVQLRFEGAKGFRQEVEIRARPGTHRHTLRVPQGRYDLVVRVEHDDGSVSQTRKKMTLRSDVHMRLTVH